MNNNLSRKRILVNGCSHTAAKIPDNPFGDPWPKIFCDKISAELINLAWPGKSNNSILEETIRYLLNDSNINHVIVYYTDWARINLFNKLHSFKWHPGDIETQFQRLGSLSVHKDKPYNRDYLYIDKDQINYDVGDLSKVHETVVAGTLTYCLYELCLAKDIGLTLVNYAPLGDGKEDTVWSKIPNDLFLFSNNQFSSVHWNFYKRYEMPDRGHFEHAFHYKFADHILAHYENKTQIEGKTESPKEKIIYDYTS